jgi:hypothetical protein
MLSFCRYIILFLITLSSCNSHKEEHNGDILRIKIPDIKEEQRTQLYASDFISDIEYIALETHPQCLIGDVVITSISENYIVVFSSNEYNCFLFSRNGKFIRKIGQRGDGPEDYYSGSYKLKIDEKLGIVFLIGLRYIYSYRITGEFIKKFDSGELLKTIDIKRISNIMHWKDNLFCADVFFESGDETYRFFIFSLDGDIIKLYPNYLKIEGVNFSKYNIDSYFFCYREQIYFKEVFSDTLFVINDQLDFVPEIIIDIQNKRTDVTIVAEPPYNKEFIRYVYKFENYIFLHGSVFCIFDKKNNKLDIIKHDHSITWERFINNESIKFHFLGLTNDIDGGLAFFPFEILFKIQNDKQFIRAFQSYELKAYLTDEYLSKRKIKDPEAHKRLKKLLSELDGDDNPVLMIATVK